MTQLLTPTALIQTHMARYPKSQIADVYKLVHQSVFGSSHAVAKKNYLNDWLEFEFTHTRPAPADFLAESISVGGDWVRLHLRPYLAQGGQAAPLAEAMRQTVKANGGSADLMEARWQVVKELVRLGHLRGETFTERETHLFGTAYAVRGWAVCHHSPAYLSTYFPKYFILTWAEADKLCKKQQIVLSLA